MIQRATIGGGTVRHDRARREDVRYDAMRYETARHETVRLENTRPDESRHDGRHAEGWRRDRVESQAPSPQRTPPQTTGERDRDRDRPAAEAADRFVDDQLFEEDVRAVLAMMRPHRRERLMGWAEYRTGGANFRATVSWDESFAHAPQTPEERWLAVPRMTDVLESILVGSLKDRDELTTAEEFEIYRGVVRELYRRLDEMQGRYE